MRALVRRRLRDIVGGFLIGWGAARFLDAARMTLEIDALIRDIRAFERESS